MKGLVIVFGQEVLSVDTYIDIYKNNSKRKERVREAAKKKFFFLVAWTLRTYPPPLSSFMATLF